MDSNASVMPWDQLIKHDFKPHWVKVRLYTMQHRIGKKSIKCKTKPLPYQNPFLQTYEYVDKTPYMFFSILEDNNKAYF